MEHENSFKDKQLKSSKMTMRRLHYDKEKRLQEMEKINKLDEKVRGLVGGGGGGGGEPGQGHRRSMHRVAMKCCCILAFFPQDRERARSIGREIYTHARASFA